MQLSFWKTPRKVYSFSLHDMEWIPNAVRSSFNDAEIIVMPGGSDWNPALYGEKVGKHTNHWERVDIDQLEVFMRAVYANKFIIGICRGAQLCCIGAGGRLIQDVNNHGSCGSHDIITSGGIILKTNSIHHQMMDFSPIDNYVDCVDLLAYANGRSTTYTNGNNEECYSRKHQRLYADMIIKEPEVAFFHKIRALAVQGHPEGYGMPKQTLEYILENIATYYKGTEIPAWTGYSQIQHRFAGFLRVYPELRATTGGVRALINFRKSRDADKNISDQDITYEDALENAESCCNTSLFPVPVTPIQSDEQPTQTISTTNNKDDKSKKKNRLAVLSNVVTFD